MTHTTITSAALALTVVAASAAAQGSITGVVRDDSTGRPVPSAEVSIGKRRTYSDSIGRYVLGKLGAGLHQVQVRRLGYQPSATLIRLEKDQTREADLSVAPAATELSAVRVNAPTPSRSVDFGEFEERRKLGFGVFIDTLVLRKNEHRHLDQLLSNTVGIRIVSPPICDSGNLRPCGQVLSRRVAVSGRASNMGGTSVCGMQVILNRAIVARGGPLAATDRDWEATFDLNSISVSSLDGVEIYRSTAEIPARFTAAGASECGVLVLWLRQGR